MPHPERAVDPTTSYSTDGQRFFSGVISKLEEVLS
jgi:phosphoribosylformylglycinamidine (FGAM) synthase-like amidotransferase family enzyme